MTGSRYNPDIHHRRSIRLRDYDYSQAGAYFLTIRCQDRECLLGRFQNGTVLLNPAGEMVVRTWQEVPDHYPGCEIDAFIPMPNHIHGIIVLQTAPVGAGPRACPEPPARADIVGAGPRARPEPPVTRESTFTIAAVSDRGQARGPAPTVMPVYE